MRGADGEGYVQATGETYLARRLTFLTETQTCIWWEQQKLTAGAWLSSVCAEAGDAMCLPEGVELVEEAEWNHDPE